MPASNPAPERFALARCGRDAHTDSRRDGGATAFARSRVMRWTVLCLLALLMSLPAAAQVKFAGVTSSVPVSNPQAAVSQFLTDSSGGIYVVDGSGLTYWEFTDGAYRSLGNIGFPDTIAWAVQAPEIFYWLTSAKIYKINSDHSITEYTFPSGVPWGSESVKGMAVDGTGRIYVATSDGTIGTIWKIGLTDSGSTHTASATPLCFSAAFGGITTLAGNRSGQLFGLANDRIVWCSESTCWTGLANPAPASTAAAADDNGNFYYASASGIVRLTPFVSNTTVQETIPFAGTPAGLGADSAGTLYASDGSSNITRIQRHAVDYGAVTIGGSGYTQSLPFHFDSATTIHKVKVVTSGAENQDYLPTANTTCHGAVNGADTSYNAGDTCNVEVKFSPKYPGLRKGAVVLLGGTDAAPVVLATVPLSGVGLGPQPTFTPGLITTVAGNGTRGSQGDGGPDTSAQLNGPVATTVDGAGNLYVAENEGNRVRKVDAATGVISTFAGNGTEGDQGDGEAAARALLAYPVGVAVDGAGNVYIAEWSGNRVRKVDAVTGIISTFAGGGSPSDGVGDGGSATGAKLGAPTGIAVDGQGNVYIAEWDGNRIRKVDAMTGLISTAVGAGTPGFSGDGGPASSARLNNPSCLALDGTGNLYIADNGNYRVRKVDAATGVISTVAGGGNDTGDGGLATDARLSVLGLAVDAADNLYIADVSANGRIRKVDAAAATPHITTVAGGGNQRNGDGGPANSATLSMNMLAELSLDPAGNLYIPEWLSGGSRIRKVTATAAPVPAGGAAHEVTISDIGNTPLTIAAVAFDTGIWVNGGCSTVNAGAGCALSISSANTTGVVQVVDNALNAANAIQPILVGSTTAPSGLDHVKLSGIYEAAAGTQQLATVRFLDSTGKLVNYSGKVQFSSSDPLAALPVPGNVTGGTAQFPIRLNTAGTQTVTVTDVSGKTATVGVVVDPTASGDWTTTTPSAPNLVVNTNADDAGDTSKCTLQASTTSNTRDAACSLRSAIAYANQAGSGNIYFDSSRFPAEANSPATTIGLTNGELTITGGTATLPITIHGPGMNFLAIQGNPTNPDRVFNIPSSSANAVLSGVTVSGGNVNNAGGGISNQGTLTVSGSTFSGNSADIGGGIYNEGTLTVSGSTFSGNSADIGGGIYNRGTLTASGSTLSGNSGVGADFIHDNNAPTAPTLRNNIISSVQGTSGGNIVNGNVTGDVATLKLAALGNYGGPTQTMLPLPGSPAICAGIRPVDGSWSLGTYDQRGQTRTSLYTDSLGHAVSCVDAGAVQTHYQTLAFTQQPTDVTSGLAMNPAPAVQFTEAGIAPSPAPDGALGSLRLLSNGSALPFTPTVANGVASFDRLSFLVPASSMTLEAALPLNASAADQLSRGLPLMPGDITLTLSSNSFGIYPPPGKLAITSWPSSTVTAQTGYAATVNVQERDGSGNLSAAATDAITLTVSKPDGSQLFTATQTASRGAVSFDLTNLDLSAAGNYTFAVSSGYLTADSKTATVTPDTASTRIAASTSAQSAVIGGAFASPLKVKVTDRFGNAIQNAAVTYAVTAATGGAGVTLSSATATTDSQGEASVTATANGVPGTYQVSASLANGSSGSFALTNTASGDTLDLSFAPVVPVYGQAVTLTATLHPATSAATPTGNIVFSEGAVNTPVALRCASGACTASQTLTLPATGAHSYSASYAGDGNFLAPNPASTTLSVGKAAALLRGPAQPVSLAYGAGGSVALQAAAVSPVQGMVAPSGGVSYTITNTSTQASTQGTAATANGAVTIPIPQTLTAGSYVVAVDYAGDSNYNPVQRTMVNLTITTAPTAGDFSLAVAATGSGSQTVLPGGSASFVLTVQPANGTVFADPVTFSISGLPQGATATLTPLSLPAGSGTTQVTLRVQMPRNTILASRHMSPLGTMPFAVGIMLLPLSGRMGRAAGRRARKLVLLLLLLTALASVLALLGCGGGGYFGQQPKSYAITITATSGGHSHFSVVNLMVQ